MKRLHLCVGILLSLGTGSLAWGVEAAPSGSMPEAMSGFSGTVEGTVATVKDQSFVLKLSKVVNTWRGNKAENPKRAVGKELTIAAKHKVHASFISTLKVGEKLKIEIINKEGKRLLILELDGAQRKRAGVGD